MEQPCPAKNPVNLGLIRKHTTTPIAIGEVFNSTWDCMQLIDYIHASVVHGGGVTHLRRIAAFADLYRIRTGCHGATDLSAIFRTAALPVGLPLPNFGIQEYMLHRSETEAVFPYAYRFADGVMQPDKEPGPGLALDHDCAARYADRRACLPVNRLEDGSMFG